MPDYPSLAMGKRRPGFMVAVILRGSSPSFTSRGKVKLACFCLFVLKNSVSASTDEEEYSVIHGAVVNVNR